VTLGPAKTDQCCQASDIKIGQRILSSYREGSFCGFSSHSSSFSVLHQALPQIPLFTNAWTDCETRYWDLTGQSDLRSTDSHCEDVESDQAKGMCLSFLSIGLLCIQV